MDALRENIKYTSDLVAAACAVLDLEYERVNAGRGEPYYPLANPGYFDPRVVALAQLVALDYLNDASEIRTPCPKTDLQLDVDVSDQARALHRVWRALNDSDCPKCHKAVAATDVIRPQNKDGVWIKCPNPSCGFLVMGDEIVEIERLFAPAMNAAVAIFESWRAKRDGDAS